MQWLASARVPAARKTSRLADVAVRLIECDRTQSAEILAILQTDGRLSGAEIGRKVNLSQPAVSARIQRLERSGVITGYQAIVDPARIGLNIHAAVRPTFQLSRPMKWTWPVGAIWEISAKTGFP